MSGALIEVTSQSAGDGFAPSAALPQGPGPESPFKHPLDSEDAQRMLRRLEDWWIEARDGHADNRREQMVDADYYDCNQWTAADAAVLMDRGQAPLTFPLIKQLCDWLIGTERRTRIDWNVLPRRDDAVKTADVKKQVLKFVSDVNGAGWARSSQFADVVKVGVGWTEECRNQKQGEMPVAVRHQDWKGMWWDPYSKDNTLKDCRYLIRAKWLDLDYAIAMCPDRADELTAKAVDTLDPVFETLELEATLPQMFFGTPNPFAVGYASSGTGNLFGSASIVRKARKRVLALETWFRKAVNTSLMLGDSNQDQSGDLDGQVYDNANPSHRAALARGFVSLVDSVSEEMYCALWTPGVLLRLSKSPYKHGRFPFTPAWGYRRHRDGMPYGAIRPARDAQDEYNKRRSKILFDLSTNRVLYEAGAFDEADETRGLDEVKRSDGEVRVAKGALVEKRIQIERGNDVVAGQIQMLAEAKANVYENGGVTRENTGTSAGEQSGRAILAKQQQGSVTTAELFDNFRQAIQESGQKTVSNCEQFLTLPQVIRVAGPDGAPAWVPINQPTFDPLTGEVKWANDITADEADFVVDETDYRETVRMAQAEMLFEMIGRLPPDLAAKLIDIAVEMTDLPNKAQLVARIRQATGQQPPGQENSPEAIAAAQEKEAEAERQRQLEEAQRTANVNLTNAKAGEAAAKADLARTNAQHKAVQGKAEALQTASMVHQAPGLAPAADRIWNPATAFPPPPNQYIPPEP